MGKRIQLSVESRTLNREELSVIPILLSSAPAIGWATDDTGATDTIDAPDAGCEKGMERARDNVC